MNKADPEIQDTASVVDKAAISRPFCICYMHNDATSFVKIILFFIVIYWNKSVNFHHKVVITFNGL